ncbi:hypothetical protein KFL_006970030 [Klebsormidium nitens]|uniref:Flagellar associated protein n=1 Tax=Klebsormidium nitens TaxID=105231 RepID=A0A1Y1IJ98_KLENI|nr:hypothetical protein KFL_006970030 [Klebsormidium nitens]|eukprot:GAQ90884.1 hypothetical protein KFL_006970030 [Klebsormidium nitens]
MAIGPPLIGKGVNPPIDTMHKGVRQGGNKSTKSFRSDIGIPGYTGFCPAFAALPPPTKGSTERLEKSPDCATFERLATATVGDHRTSHYRDTMRPPRPALYEKARKTLQETARLRETAVNVQPGGYANQASVYSLSNKHVTQSGTSFLDKPRNSSTKDTLLYDLTQFSQGRTPFYSGFRPKAACNVRPPGEPSPQTTQGYANNSVRMLIEKRGGVLSIQRQGAAVARK